jgi:hypothetical protein
MEVTPISNEYEINWIPEPVRHNEGEIDILFLLDSGVPRNFFWGVGVQQIQLRTEDRENRNMGAAAP